MGQAYSFTPRPTVGAQSTILITGGNNGLGFEMAKQIAEAGAFANVVIASRNLQRGETAAEKIRETARETTQVGVLQVDLSDMEGVRKAAMEFSEQYDHLDVLCNNAGIMAPPKLDRIKTKDSSDENEKLFTICESQMATNLVGHWLLTRQLFPMLVKSGSGRVVNLSSIAHKAATQKDVDIMLNDPGFVENEYKPMPCYNASKISANYFSLAFNEHAKNAGLADKVDAVTAHPGVSDSDLFKNVMPDWAYRGLVFGLRGVGVVSDIKEGTQSQVRAAVDRDFVKSGDFIGPSGFRNMVGAPVVQEPTDLAKSKDNAMKLWQTVERLTGVQFKMTK